MYDHSDIHRRLKHNFHYAKGDPQLRARAMTLLRVLASIEGGKSVEQATRQFKSQRFYAEGDFLDNASTRRHSGANSPEIFRVFSGSGHLISQKYYRLYPLARPAA